MKPATAGVTALLSMPREAAVLEKLVVWGSAHPAIRAMVLSSSLARPGGPVDLLSDYDIILAVTDPGRFGRNGDWLCDYGEPLARWGDEGELCGLTTVFHGVFYADYVKIDYTVWPEVLLERIAALEILPDELDGGYRVLLDKDGRTSGWKPPSYKAHVPARPTEAEYHALVEEFWWSATYVAKSLWRDELVFARFVLDQELRLGVLRRMLEWRIEIDHNWSLKPGVWGRGLKRLLPADLWSELERTFVGPDPDENWAAFFRTTALFRRVATEVAAALGYAYPQSLDDRMSAYLNAVRELPAEAGGPGSARDEQGRDVLEPR
jgi:aminoglycoside 6-adenylyltransferase